MYPNVIYPGEAHKHTFMIVLKTHVDGFPKIPEPVQLALALSWEKCLPGHPISSFWPIHLIF